MKTVLILLGPPGAGKGTQAERLCAELSLPHVSTGDLFRENLSQGTELGERARSYMNAGKLVPDEVVVDMLADRVSRPDCQAGYLLDGFPRTIPQAEALETMLADRAELRVLSLRVPAEVLIKRLTGRRTCGSCGNLHHMEFSPPAAEGVCDKCGGELTQRSDDSPEVVGKRLEVYEEETRPLEGFYADRGLLAAVDGDRTPDEVFADLVGLARGEEVG